MVGFIKPTTVRFWPISAVRPSIAGCRSEKVTNGHDRPQLTRSGPRSLLGNVLLRMLEKHHPAGSEEHRRYEA